MTSPPLLQHAFRVCFLLASLWAALAVPLWLLAYTGEIAISPAYGDPAWHAHEMIYGYAALVVCGCHGLSKDNCRFVCAQDPDGLPVRTLDGEDFLAVNGVQTLSHTCCDLLGDIDGLRDAGVRSLRLSPQDCDMVEVARIFRSALDGTESGEAATRRLRMAYPAARFSNGFLRGTAGVSWEDGGRAAGSGWPGSAATSLA